MRTENRHTPWEFVRSVMMPVRSWKTAVTVSVLLMSAVVADDPVAGGVLKPDSKLRDFVGDLEYPGQPEERHPLRISSETNLIPLIGQKSGLKKGDEIVSINNKVWNDQAEALRYLASAEASGFLELQITGKSVVQFVTKEAEGHALRSLGLEIEKLESKPITLKSTYGMSFEAGLRASDEIRFLDGKFFDTREELQHELAKLLRLNGRISLTVVSQGQQVTRVLPPRTGGAVEGPALTRGIQSHDTGRQVGFPRFLGPQEEQIPPRADRRQTKAHEVVTARVELYYFRDAHRVAQILNRDVKSFNGPSVTQFERAAESAREQFEEKRLDRRRVEQEAREAALELKFLEERLVRDVGALRAEMERQAEADRAKAAAASQSSASSQSSSTNSTTNINVGVNNTAGAGASGQGTATGGSTTTNLDGLRKAVEAALANVQTKRVELLRKQGAADRANDEEQLAAKEQFRREVSAAKVDPDTFVPGDIGSIDPVTQVSISVIGEGVLHLRGPRAGVNKIRYMIDQIDHPVGQVKVGVMTVQLNGENGPRMENTMRRVEGNISRARFLAYVSNQLFTRAVVETANKIAVEAAHMPLRNFTATHAQPESPEQEERWKRYLEAFFGEDFLAEIQDVDKTMQLLNPRHKLLALHSMDTITLAEALFITALAKHSVRDQILLKLQQFLECDLPEKEVNWIVTNKIYRHTDPKWWGDAKQGRIKTYENAILRYKFSAIRTYFERLYEHGDLSANILNPLQREVVKLAQGISLEQALQIQRDAMIQKRSVLKEACCDETCQRPGKPRQAMSHLDQYFLDQQIDDLEEKHLNAVESLRGRKAAIDKLIKSVVIAIEDDVTGQFYDPALERIRRASWEWDVELAAIERTTILTNNRAFGKVVPQASFEFDLPRRDIALAEALKAASALQKDVGPLLADPGFATLAQGFTNSPLNGGGASVKSVLPGLPSGTDQQDLLYGDNAARKHSGLELEKLIPDPAIYKFETGTGYEIRPVVQPDGQSVQFDFNYMYTTDLLEPVRANEKHLGRVKRHFINTEVQLGNLEWREISRYEVALKAERNARGVPLLEDIPVLGVLARPLPQAQKSLQKNIIIGQASIYPTVEDLLSLKPANLCHMDIAQTLCDAEKENQQNEKRFRDINQRLSNQVDCLLDSFGQAPKANCDGHGDCQFPEMLDQPVEESGPPPKGATLLPPQPLSQRRSTPTMRPASQQTVTPIRSVLNSVPRSTPQPYSNSTPRNATAPISPDIPAFRPTTKPPPIPLKVPIQSIRPINHEEPPEPVSVPNTSRVLLPRNASSKASTSAPDVSPPRRSVAR